MHQILRDKVNFTINGFAISIKDIFNNIWMKKMITLPHAIPDMRAKQLRLNTGKKDFFGSDLYACIRFISQGFKKPSKDEIEILLLTLKKLPKYKFERNKEKLFSYVGGKEKAEKIAKTMGLNKNIFLMETIMKLRQSRSHLKLKQK